MPTKTVTLRLPPESYSLFREAAERDHRSLANLIETAALRHLEEHAETGEAETRKILSNPSLLKRLKQGHEDARRGRGRFLD